MDGWTDGTTGGRTDGRTDGWMETINCKLARDMSQAVVGRTVLIKIIVLRLESSPEVNSMRSFKSWDIREF
jgi:hypothetical protein